MRWTLGGGQENQSASVSPNARVDDRVNAASVHELELAKVEDHEARLQLGRGHLKRPQCGRLKWPHLRPTGGRLFIMPFMPFVIQNISIGVALIQDNSPQRVFPRRVAYFNFWIAALFLPGGLLTFFKTGPLVYNGVLAFWISVIIFCIWMLVMPWATHQAVRSEPQVHSQDASPSSKPAY
jgi:hypothetical protein